MRNEPLDFRAVRKGLANALIITGALLGAGLLVIIMAEPGDFYGGTFVNGVILAGVLYGGGVAGARAKTGGWRHGMLTGAVCGIVVLAVGLAVVPELFTWYEAVTRLLVLALAGAGGGIVGVNLPPLPHRGQQRQRYYG